jgi:hypothetical protein
MSDATLGCFALLALITIVCAVVIAWRLRRQAVVRADSEQRAAAAFEAMYRLGRDLRQRRQEASVTDSARPGSGCG